MIRFFKSPQPAILFVVPLIVLLLWLQAFFKQPFIFDKTGGPLYIFFSGLLNNLPTFLQVLITIALITLEAIYLNDILNRHEVLNKNSYLPALVYSLLMSFAFPVLQFHPVILVNIFLLRAIDKIFMLFKNDSPISPLFDSFFLVSIASLVYFPATVILILFLISLAILRQFSIREWMIAIIGFMLPYFFASVYLFYSGQFISGWKKIFNVLIPGHIQFGFTVEKPQAILFGLIALLLLMALRKLIQGFYKNTVRTRNYQQILGLLFVISAASSFFLERIPFFHITMLALPLSVFISYYFLVANKRIWFSETLLWGLILLIAWNNF